MNNNYLMDIRLLQKRIKLLENEVQQSEVKLKKVLLKTSEHTRAVSKKYMAGEVNTTAYNMSMELSDSLIKLLKE